MAKFYLQHTASPWFPGLAATQVIYALPYAKTRTIARRDAIDRVSDLEVGEDDVLELLDERMKVVEKLCVKR